MILHTVGDCHADSGWARLKSTDTPFDEIDYNGVFSITMARFGIEKLGVLDISTYYPRTTNKPTYDLKLREKWNLEHPAPYNHYFNIKNGDAVLFCMGEIECRSHFSKPIYSDVWKNLVDEIVPLYFEAIKVSVDKFDHLHTMIFNVIPGISDETFIKYCPQYPREGTTEVRKSIYLYVNSKLKEYCEKYNYIFFDVYDKYCDENGFLNINYSDTCAHIENPIHYIEFLNNLKF